MAAVQQRVLNWLYSVLTSEYHDVNRVYNDTAQVLSQYSSLAPKTDVYTYENGTSALLLNVSGTLPVDFRGMTYNYPISIWIPHTYPRDSPMVYVVPAVGMAVRAGQYVDPQGKVYHPYLASWPEFSDKYNVVTFIAVLRDIFGKEPPVIARQHPNDPSRTSSIPPPRPPLPNASGSSESSTGPPRPPPKPPQIAPERVQSPSSYIQSRESQGPPPLPPLPPQLRGASPKGSPSLQRSSIYGQVTQPQRQSSLRYDNPPPLPQPARQHSRQETSYQPISPVIQDNYGQRYSQQPPENYPGNQYQGPPQPPPGYINSAPQYQTQQPPYQNPQPQFRQPPPQQPLPPQQKPPSPPQDLLDAPLALLQSTSPNVPPPPIPPNPEKDALLLALSKTLHSTRLQHTSRIQSVGPPLTYQKTAMLTALNTLNQELSSLTALSTSLASNTQILQTSLQTADSTIESSKSMKAPNIDEILVAPTMVANQLYEAVCEERALGDALFVLGRAVERGRIGGGTFVRVTRGLGRELFLKKVLVRKIARGMGLDGA